MSEPFVFDHELHSAWLAVLVASIVTFLLGLWVWQMPLGDGGIRAYLYGSATGVWNVARITFWGVMLFNTLDLPYARARAGHVGRKSTSTSRRNYVVGTTSAALRLYAISLRRPREGTWSRARSPALTAPHGPNGRLRPPYGLL
jgi:hypothetical protein